MNVRNSGFTFIELLIAMTILSIIATFTFIGFQNYALYQQYDQSVGGVLATLVDTRLSARSSEGGQAHGVKFFTNSIVVFPGNSYSAVNPDNEELFFEAVTITPTLAGGVDEIIFNSLTGLPSTTGTITLDGVSYAGTRTIEISATGVIQ